MASRAADERIVRGSRSRSRSTSPCMGRPKGRQPPPAKRSSRSSVRTRSARVSNKPPLARALRPPVTPLWARASTCVRFNPASRTPYGGARYALPPAEQMSERRTCLLRSQRSSAALSSRSSRRGFAALCSAPVPPYPPHARKHSKDSGTGPLGRPGVEAAVRKAWEGLPRPAALFLVRGQPAPPRDDPTALPSMRCLQLPWRRPDRDAFIEAALVGSFWLASRSLWIRRVRDLLLVCLRMALCRAMAGGGRSGTKVYPVRPPRWQERAILRLRLRGSAGDATADAWSVNRSIRVASSRTVPKGPVHLTSYG